MSQQLDQLRVAAQKIFEAALRAVDAREVTRQAIVIHCSESSANRPIYAVCMGKAAYPMALAIDEVIGNRIKAGVVTSQIPAHQRSAKWSYFAGGHPFPNAESLRAAEATFDLLDTANNERADVIFAVSGGGSAMIESPVNDDISLGDLQEANRILVTCGATIAEINTVRRAFSKVKGGKLAAQVPNADIITFIVSDTNRGDEANVASGPTLTPTDINPSAREIVERFNLAAKLPRSIVRVVTESEDVVTIKQSPHYVLADNQTAIDAAVSAAKELGFTPVVAEDVLEQSIEEGCKMLVQRVSGAQGRFCLISGGEFSCPVRESGVGGRNSETVLRCALQIARLDVQQSFVVFSAGTDGVDGNSRAAGAIADNTSLERAAALNMDASEFLARSDSFTFFEKLGDAIITGPTGTNVRDIRILLSDSDPGSEML